MTIDSGFGAAEQAALPPSAQKILDSIVSRGGCVTLSLAEIGRIAGVGRSSAGVAIAILVAAGRLRRVETGGGRGRKTTYHATEIPSGQYRDKPSGNRPETVRTVSHDSRAGDSFRARTCVVDTTSSSLRSEEESAASLRSAAAAVRESANEDASNDSHAAAAACGVAINDLLDEISAIVSAGRSVGLNAHWLCAGPILASLRAEGVTDDEMRAAAVDLGSRPRPSGPSLLAIKAREIHQQTLAAVAAQPDPAFSSHRPAGGGYSQTPRLSDEAFEAAVARGLEEAL